MAAPAVATEVLVLGGITLGAVYLVSNPTTRAAIAGAINAGISSLTKNLQPYDVGTHGDLKGKSTPGDGLDIHHVPQAHPAGQTIPGYDKSKAPAIALPQGEHERIPVEKGDPTRTPADQLKKDIGDLKTHTNAPSDAIQKVEELAKQKYPVTQEPSTSSNPDKPTPPPDPKW